MNKKLIPLLLVLVALFQGCRGPEGDPGADGVNVVGSTIDLVDVNFNAGNNFEYSMSYDRAELEVLESDALLIYVRWEDVESGNQTVKTFRLMPQTAFLTGNQILTYNYDQTISDFSIFLDGTANLANLPAAYTQDQEFRIVVIPADFVARKNGAVDYNDYDAVVKAFNIDESKIRKVSAK
ncbi:hypothetical protein DYBT9623_04036 [Dyadobacter sp. CECT 9623]|uniref:Collagen-like protein n=1 Tax=Dyadobacter linearis TaxID=2823330 RepID=A0ABN7RIG7_9BACT|nr:MULTISPECIES: hypothetical protein [unclassified Dyadobacter]MCE7059619.1 hypothetical protein [Dyadobacter sp. CY343]CAG5072107.1 hypothetical protein DYBT9623_04036 [Dyadobacter sp. CECT 9623]